MFNRLKMLSISKNLPDWDKRQLLDTIASLELELSVLELKTKQAYAVYSGRLENFPDYDLDDPESLAIAVHEMPDLVYSNKIDINKCRWYSILALCVKYRDLVSYVDVDALKLSFYGKDQRLKRKRLNYYHNLITTKFRLLGIEIE